MKVLVTGGSGMLGRDLERTLRSNGFDVTAAARADLDVTRADACREMVAGHDVVVNAAAWTKVDEAETREADAFAVNALGAANVARACRESSARVIQISTDYVFAGDGKAPYAESADIAPICAYGRTKASGEWAVRAECPDSLIVRTAWLYGAGGPNFVKTMARLAHERGTVKVIDDQWGQPTATSHLSQFISDLISASAPAGLYHGTSSGLTTWYGFARAIFEQLNLDPDAVHPIGSAEFPLPAPRPAYSVLGHAQAESVGVAALPDWHDALAETIHDVLKGNS